MRARITTLLGAGALLGAVGCGADNSAYIGQLQEALAQSRISLRESIPVAESAIPGAAALQARLRVGSMPVYSVGAFQSGALRDVRVDIVSGAVLSMSELRAGASSSECGSIGLADALSIAEAAVSGRAVAVEPDDDDACLREIQVLSGDTLWEVKLAPDGTVLETEVSDEDGTGDDESGPDDD